MATKLVLEVQVGRRALERLLDGPLSRFVKMVAFEAVSAGKGSETGPHIVRYMTDIMYVHIIELDKLQVAARKGGEGRGGCQRAGATVAAAHLSEVMALPLSPSHSSVMPAVV